MPKVSWLDSCRLRSNIHLADVSGESTLCGHPFKLQFDAGIWIPYRVTRGGKKRKSLCKGCLEIAKEQGISHSEWHSLVPENDFTKSYEDVVKEARLRKRGT